MLPITTVRTFPWYKFGLFLELKHLSEQFKDVAKYFHVQSTENLWHLVLPLLFKEQWEWHYFQVSLFLAEKAVVLNFSKFPWTIKSKFERNSLIDPRTTGSPQHKSNPHTPFILSGMAKNYSNYQVLMQIIQIIWGHWILKRFRYILMLSRCQ